VAKCVSEVNRKEEVRRDRSEEERVGVNKGWSRDRSKRCDTKYQPFKWKVRVV